jgi:hypothetical protein
VGVLRPEDRRPSGRRRQERTLPVGADLVGEVRVEIDEAREYGGAAEVDDAIALQLRLAPDPFDPIAADQDGCARERRPAAPVDDARRPHDHRPLLLRSRAPGQRRRRRDQDNCQSTHASTSRAF